MFAARWPTANSASSRFPAKKYGVINNVLNGKFQSLRTVEVTVRRRLTAQRLHDHLRSPGRDTNDHRAKNHLVWVKPELNGTVAPTPHDTQAVLGFADDPYSIKLPAAASRRRTQRRCVGQGRVSRGVTTRLEGASTDPVPCVRRQTVERGGLQSPLQGARSRRLTFYHELGEAGKGLV